MSPDERAAYRAKFQEKDKSARARKQLLEFWANCTGEARAQKCAHLMNPEAQAKSHAAQRTPEFLAKKSAWAKAALARKTPEERRAAIEKQKETKRRKREERIARGEIVPAARKPKTRMNRSSPEYRAHQSEALKQYWAKWRETHPKPPKPPKPTKPPKPPKPNKPPKSQKVKKRKPRMRPTSRRSKILLAYNGKMYSIKELSKESGVPTYVIAARHEKNWPVERILAEPFQPKPRQFLTYQGVTLSQCAWAKKLGIRQTTISARMQKGLPVEMVLTIGRVPRSRPLT